MADKSINIDNLVDSYLELAATNPDILDDMLTAEGYNADAVQTRALQKIRHLFFREQVSIKKASLSNLYNKAISMMQQATETSKESIFNLLKLKAPSFQFRNLEKLDEENLRQILDETEILDLIYTLERSELK